jgi:hypothetical protein
MEKARWTRWFTWFGPPERNTLRPRRECCIAVSVLFKPGVQLSSFQLVWIWWLPVLLQHKAGQLQEDPGPDMWPRGCWNSITTSRVLMARSSKRCPERRKVRPILSGHIPANRAQEWAAARRCIVEPHCSGLSTRLVGYDDAACPHVLQAPR